MKDKYSKYIAQGRCVKCGKPNDRETELCSVCSEKKRLQRQELYRRRVSMGLCVKCGEKARPGATMCFDCARRCAEWQVEYERKKREEKRNGKEANA